MNMIVFAVLVGAFLCIFLNNRKMKKAADKDRAEGKTDGKYDMIPDDPKVVFAYLAWKRGEITKYDLDRIKAESEERAKKEAETTKASDIKKLN